jgi:peptidoglycan/LPS O-acetylase OafA/YrhL
MISLFAMGRWLFPSSPLFGGSLPLWVYPLYAQNLMGDFTRSGPWLGPSWSLAVEEQFYLLFPAIVRLCSRKVLIRVLAGCILGAPVLRTAMIMYGYDFPQVYPLLPCRADVLALGAVAAIMVRSEEARNWIKENYKLLYWSLLTLAAAVSTMLKWTAFPYVGTIGYSMIGAMYFLLLLLLLVAPLPALKAAFQARWLGWLGTVSYCVYLVHEPVRVGVFLLFGLGDKPSITGMKSLFATLTALAVTLAIAQASWLLIEKRLIKRAHQRYRY